MKTRRFCPKCGRMLIKSRMKDYSFQCMNCDEDFYRIEVLTKKQKRTLWKENLEEVRNYQRIVLS